MDMRSLVESCLPQKPAPKDMLFHYTSAAGLVGILQSHTVWATHVYFLNDWNECDRAIGHATHLIQKRLAGPSGPVAALADAIDNELQNFPTQPHVCIFSLSAARDLLSQWRAYGASGGYCLGFWTSTFVRPFARAGYAFGHCLYKDRQQLSAVSRLFSHFVQQADTEPRPDRRTLRNLAKQFWLAVMHLAPFFKDRSFLEENEWRLVSPAMAPADLKFRVGSGKVIPYAEAPFKISSLREIIIGPMHETYLAEDALKILLANAGVRRCKIDHTKTTLRQ